MGMEATDRFAILAEVICENCFSGRLPSSSNAPEQIASALAMHILPKVAEFWRVPNEIAQLALAGFSERLCDALRAHVALETPHWTC